MVVVSSKMKRVLKRRRWRPEDAEMVLAAWEASGLTMARFAQEHGFVLSRLERWPDRLRRHARGGPTGSSGSDAVSLLPVRVVGQVETAELPCAPAALQVSVGAAVVRVPHAFDPDHLVRVVRALASWC